MGTGFLETALRSPAIGKVARKASDWIDLEWSYVILQLEEVAPIARGNLLDVGCGDKPYEYIFRPHVTSYYGIEHEASYQATSADARANKPDGLYDGMHLPFDDGRFDTVMCIQVLEHTPEPAALISEMARVLRDDGVMILSVPFSFRLHEEPHDYFRFSSHILRKLCVDAGMRVVEIRPRGSVWSVIGHKLNSYLGLHVAKVGSLAQSMGKLGHEASSSSRPRTWTLPVIAPTMASISFSARVLDRIAPDPTEMLGFLVIARKQ